MFKPLAPEVASPVEVTIDGRVRSVPAGISVAAAMLLAGQDSNRTTPVTGARRGPYCLMGACFDCLVEIDDVPNRQGCLVTVRHGMRIAKAQGAREAEVLR